MLMEKHGIGMSRNPVLRKMFGPEDRQKFHNADLHGLCPSSHIIRAIRGRSIWWTGHVTFMWENRNACRFLSGIPKERGRLGDLSVDEIMVLNISHRNWIHLFHFRGQWRALDNAAINLRIPYWPAKDLLSSQEGLCSIELIILYSNTRCSESWSRSLRS